MYTYMGTQFCLSLGYNNHTTYALPQWPRGFSQDVTLCMARDAIERARKLTVDPFSFQCTQHVGPIMPWVLAWVPWHQSAQPFCNSAFSSDIQGNRNRITTRKERWNKVGWGWVCLGKSMPRAEHCEVLSLWYTLIWPPTSYDPCIFLCEQHTPGQAHPSITVIRCTNECHRAEGQWLSWSACW